MKDTEFVVNAFRKGMSIEEMNGFAHGLSAQYAEGYGHHEGFDAGDLAIVVMKRYRDEAQAQLSDTNPPDLLCAAQTLNTALQQANQTIEYLRNEIDSLKKMNAGQSVNINAVSSSSLAESYNDLRRRLKEVEQQIANEGNAGLRVHVASERLKAALEGLNAKPEMMTVEDAKTLANVAYNRAYLATTGGYHSQKDFESWWIEFRKENGFVNEQKAERIYNQSSQDVYAQLYVLGQEYLGWHDLDKQVSKKDSDFNKFWTRMQEIYGDGCVSAKCVDAINRGTDQGFSRADYIKLIADEIVANQSEGQAEPTPTDSVFEGIMSELKNIAGATMGWSDFETEAPNIALYGSFWKAIHIRFGYENEGRKVSDGNRREYLESIANNIVQWRKDNPNEEPKPKADAITADEVLPRIKALAMQFFGWAHEWMQGIVSEQDKSIQLFHTLVADEYELELNIEATNKGLRLFDITRMQYLEKVAQSVADALNK